MELYDKKYVYFEWDDKLEGKKGFFANTINELKTKVENGFELLECHFSNNHAGFHFSNSISNSAYQFFYYDPYYEIRRAYNEGKQIQFKDWNDDWVDVADEPLLKNGEYRIKPNEIKYVPFDTVQELIDCWDNKYPQNKSRPKGTMPLIWIKEKEKDIRTFITEYYFERDCHEADVGTSRDYISLKSLFYDYTFLDGTVIGKVAK
jgi:hypothetical protein